MSDESDELENEPDDPQGKILWAAEHNRMEIIESLLQTDPSLVHSADSDGYTPLHRAAYSNHVNMVKVLLAKGASLTKCTNDGWQPLHSACRWNNAEVADVLLKNGADINARTNGGQTALHLAASLREAQETVSLLLKNPQIDPSLRNKCQETAYQIAYRSGEHYKLFGNNIPMAKSLDKVGD